jgi:hypothetical protein
MEEAYEDEKLFLFPFLNGDGDTTTPNTPPGGKK